MAQTTIGGIPDTLSEVTDETLFEAEADEGAGQQGFKTPAPLFRDYITATTGLVEINSSRSVGTDLFGKTVINDSASFILLDIPLNAGFPVGSRFNMTRNASGNFQIAAFAGVTINGIDTGFFELSYQYDSAVVTNISNNEWVVSEYHTLKDLVEVGASQVLSPFLINKNVASNSALDILITIPFNAGLESGSSFNMIRNTSGKFDIRGFPGVSVNGADSGVFEILSQYSGAFCLNISENEWVVMGYKDDVIPTYQQIYDNHPLPTTFMSQNKPVEFNSFERRLDTGVFTIDDGGTGYTVNDILTVVGGVGDPIKLRVSIESAGVITQVIPIEAGNYTTVPANPVSVTGGTGTGAMFTLGSSPTSTFIMGNYTQALGGLVVGGTSTGATLPDYLIANFIKPVGDSRAVGLPILNSDERDRLLEKLPLNGAIWYNSSIGMLEVSRSNIAKQIPFQNELDTQSLRSVYTTLGGDLITKNTKIVTSSQILSLFDLTQRIQCENVAPITLSLPVGFGGSIGDVIPEIVRASGSASVTIAGQLGVYVNGILNGTFELEPFSPVSLTLEGTFPKRWIVSSSSSNIPDTPNRALFVDENGVPQVSDFFKYDRTLEELETNSIITGTLQSIGSSRVFSYQNTVNANREITQADFGAILSNGNGSGAITLLAAGAGMSPEASFSIWQPDINVLTVTAPAGVTIDGVESGSVSSEPGVMTLIMRDGDDWYSFKSNSSSGSDLEYGEVYFNDNESETVIATAATPVKIVGTYVADFLSGFNHGAGTLTYTGVGGDFKLDVSLSCTMDLAIGTVSVIVYKNGSPVAKSKQQSFLGSTSPATQNINCTALVTLEANDTIEVFIQNDLANNNITVTQFNCIPKKIAGGSGSNGGGIVTSWNGLTTPTSVTPGINIDITGGVISVPEYGASATDIVLSSSLGMSNFNNLGVFTTRSGLNVNIVKDLEVQFDNTAPWIEFELGFISAFSNPVDLREIAGDVAVVTTNPVIGLNGAKLQNMTPIPGTPRVRFNFWAPSSPEQYVLRFNFTYTAFPFSP